MKTQDLTAAARTALTNAGNSNIGSTVPTERMTPEVILELAQAGLIGPHGGLTMKGSILRDRIQDEDLDLLF